MVHAETYTLHIWVIPNPITTNYFLVPLVGPHTQTPILIVHLVGPHRPLSFTWWWSTLHMGVNTDPITALVAPACWSTQTLILHLADGPYRDLHPAHLGHTKPNYYQLLFGPACRSTHTDPNPRCSLGWSTQTFNPSLGSFTRNMLFSQKY